VERLNKFRRDLEREIAAERIQILLKLAQETYRKDKALTQRYVDLAKSIVTKSKVKIPLQYKRLICKHCGRFMMPGVDSRIRIRQRREPHIVITCLHCQGRYRLPLRRRKKMSKPNRKKLE